MLAGMAPVLDARDWRFVLVKGAPPADAFAVIREDEGTTAIMAGSDMAGSGMAGSGMAGSGEGAAFARITLMVHSALEGVGLTAAVSTALAEAGIACNVVAGFHHDHLFVPWERRDEALELLQRLSQTG